MRFYSLAPAVLAMCISGTASAQSWEEYVNRGDFFTVNFPGDPARQDIVYQTAKGTSLPAHVYTAEDDRGHYTVTVINYSSAQDELGTAIEDAVNKIRARGEVKYEGVNMLDNHRSWRITVETPDQRRVIGEVLTAANNNLYMTQSETALNVPPPAQFNVSLQILDENGVRIRYRQVQPATPDEVVPVTPEARAIETARMEKLVAGAWRDPAGGSCDAAFLKTAERLKTVRGEEAMAGTITNNGVVVNGQLILQGPREGQLIDPRTDKAVLLFEPLPENKLGFSAIGEPALGWPDVTTELCPGSRGS